MIDLHSHTDKSDGSYSPKQLIDLACRTGIRILGITDHDTFAGYDQALQVARDSGVELICGIELSTKLFGHTAHLLGYFLHDEKLDELRTWLLDIQVSRHERNGRLIARLQELGLDIKLEEVEARGRGMTGRPHFAQVIVEKRYAQNLQEAFDNYLDESAKAYVHRHEPEFTKVVHRIRKAGGIASLAHPVRLKGDVSSMLPALCDAGLNAIEAYHSDHQPQDTEAYLRLAEQHGLLVTGGSDFHGSAKPDIELGTGRCGNVNIPEDLVDRMRGASRRS